MTEHFVEIESYNIRKDGEPVSGDIFISRKIPEDNRIVAVLADGLGSGIKANVLATLTATMASRFTEGNMTITDAANIIMSTLPVCNVRKIGYSTFTLIDMQLDGNIRIVEYENPAFLLFNGNKEIPVDREIMKLHHPNKAIESHVYISSFKLNLGDHLLFFSDGVTQAGMGSLEYPFGWGLKAASAFIADILTMHPKSSSRTLTEKLTREALRVDKYKAKDDITCGAIYVRNPRNTLLVTGPPFDMENDKLMAKQVAEFNGKKLICGGTTATIISRELNRPVSMPLDIELTEIPPAGTMEGVDLVTEGTITLSMVAKLLELNSDEIRADAAGQLAAQLRNSDIVNFLVGTKINEAHQDPNLPHELDIRRNIIKKLAELLEKKYLKKVLVRYL